MIPCCFHPTRVILVDDDREFLDNLHNSLSHDYASYQHFNDPEKALHYLNEVYTPNPFPNRYIQAIDEDKWEHRRLDVNVWDTHHEVYRPERFKEISVIVVDHSMPDMSGIELCRQITDPNVQKILLTGMTGHDIVIRAFNEGIIHHYIDKQASDMAEQVNQAIESAQWRYFNKLSEVTLKAITSDDLVNHAVVDPNFQSLFKNLLKQHGLREAYLCESMGSYVFLTEHGVTHGLVVNSADQLEVSCDSAEALEIDTSLLEELKNQKKMMFYHSRQAILEPPAKEWKNHVYSPQILQGKQEIYYYVFEPNLFDLDLSRVLPFGEYKAGKISVVK
jgi:CheY-like chemotaxis protein